MTTINSIINACPSLAKYFDCHCGNFIIPVDECDELIHCGLAFATAEFGSEYELVLDDDGEDEYIILAVKEN